MLSNVRSIAFVTGMVALVSTSQVFAQDTLAVGKKVFAETAAPACAVCHALKNAGAEGAIGPNLDELKPDASRVEMAVRNGIGQMPAFQNLSDDQIKAVAQYVSSVAGK